MIDRDEGRPQRWDDERGWLWILTAILYGWLLVNLILLMIPSHKPLHDRLTHTIVLRTAN